MQYTLACNWDKALLKGKALLSILILLSLATSAGTAASIDEMLSYIQSLDTVRSKRVYQNIPLFSKEEYRRTLGGECVIKRWEVEDGEKAGGLIKVMDLPAWKVWTIIVDRSHYKSIFPEMKESAILKRVEASTVSYHYIDVPIPFVADRQQVLVSTTNTELWEKSGGKMAEYYWRQDDSALELIGTGVKQRLIQEVSPGKIKEAVVVKKNEGAWLLIPLPDGRTLVEGYAISDPGGSIPKSLVDLLKPTDSLKDTINLMERWGLEELDDHLKDNHEKILAPTGKFVDPDQLVPLFGNP